MSPKGLAVFAVAFTVAWAATKIMIPLLRRNGIVDVPNTRSSHHVPTPRGGGAAIIAGLGSGFFVAWLLGLQLPTPELLFGTVLVALMGSADDRFEGLSVGIRLVVQALAAGIVVIHAGGIVSIPLPEPLNVSTGQFAIPLALIWILAVTNIYNFLDGIDGFAGLQGVAAGLGVAFLTHSSVFAVVGFAVAGACAGFLMHNWHPAKIFMGDIGSGTLGFLLAALPFELNSASRSDAIFFVAICLWFFLSDGVFTILRRLSSGEKVWQPHRSHLYQRLVKAGLQHDRVVVTVIGAATLLIVLAVRSLRVGESSARWSVLAAAMCGFIGYYFWTTMREKDLGSRAS